MYLFFLRKLFFKTGKKVHRKSLFIFVSIRFLSHSLHNFLVHLREKKRVHGFLFSFFSKRELLSWEQPKICLVETTDIITAPQLQQLWWHIEKENTLRVSNFIETRENNKRFICPCVHFSKPPQTHPHQWREKNRMRLSYPRTSMINACPFSFDVFFNTFWFLLTYYHFFSDFSTVHLSFMEMAKRHKNFESYFLRHYISSNHFFLCFFPLRTARRETFSYLFFLNWYGKLTDAAQVSWHQSCRGEFFLCMSEDKLEYELHELYVIDK